MDDVIAHPFFSELDVKKLLKKEVRYLLSDSACVQLEPAFKPKLTGDRYDVTNFDQKVTTMEPKESFIGEEEIKKIMAKLDPFKDDFDTLTSKH